MKKTAIALVLAVLPIFFTVFGAGHFYLRRSLEGMLFLVAGYINLFLAFLYLPFEFDSLISPNFLVIISEFSSDELMAPVITLVVWGGLISASIIRVAHLSKTSGMMVKQ